MDKKMLIFDFDGVLVDTLMICYEINTQVNDELSVDEYKSFFEGNIFAAVRSNGAPRNKHPEFFDQYRSKTRELVIPDEHAALVRRLAERYILTVASSTDSSCIADILARHGIRESFKDILGADVHASKVVKIRSLLEKFAVSADNAIFITDTVGDIREGKECGVNSIAVTWGFHERVKLESEKPHAVVDTVPELEHAIERFFAARA